MNRLVVAAVLVPLAVACSSSEEAEPTTTTALPTVSPTVPPPLSTSTTESQQAAPPTSIPTPSREELAVAAAQEAVLAEGVMSAEFVESSVGTVRDLGDTLEVTLLPADPDTIGATAVVILSADDLSVLQVDNYR